LSGDALSGDALRFLAVWLGATAGVYLGFALQVRACVSAMARGRTCPLDHR
jgi:hypothetical protein